MRGFFCFKLSNLIQYLILPEPAWILVRRVFILSLSFVFLIFFDDQIRGVVKRNVHRARQQSTLYFCHISGLKYPMLCLALLR
jgi:hypothetical protein